MAQAALSQEDLKALDKIRQQLFQLSNNVASLKADVLRTNPLPQWYVGICSLNHSPARLNVNANAAFMQVVSSNIRIHPSHQCQEPHRPLLDPFRTAKQDRRLSLYELPWPHTRRTIGSTVAEEAGTPRGDMGRGGTFTRSRTQHG